LVRPAGRAFFVATAAAVRILRAGQHIFVMHSLKPWLRGLRPGTAAVGIVFFLVGLVPTRAATFRHATLGRIEVYTSDNPDNTRHFLCELMEVRRQVQELVAPVPLPDPRIQIVVFSRRKDYEEFLPEPDVTKIRRAPVAGFTLRDYGLTAAVVKEGGFGYDFGRETLLAFYASYLLMYAVPDAPTWIRVGLPECLAATESRGNSVLVGGDFMDHQRNIKPSKLLPLAQLMDDAAMAKYDGVLNHQNVLYQETWLLWQQWLADPNPARRQQVRQLFAAIREGHKGDLATVVEAFGESAEAIEAARKAPKTARGFPLREANTDAAALVRGLVIEPATEIDLRMAQAMVAASTGRGPGSLTADLHRLADAQPNSPRPAEALAALAMADKDSDDATGRWARARELGTDNPFAYLQPVQEALGSRQVYLSMEAQLPEALSATWRGLLDQCLARDPGLADAHYYRVMLEAIAPVPDRAALDRTQASGALEIRPLGQLYLAIARWRLGDTDAAHRLLGKLYRYPPLGDAGRAQIAAIDSAMRQKEAKSN
jgi:hypothetical protein